MLCQHTGIRSAGVSRIDAVLLDSRKELGLLLVNLGLQLPIEDIENLIAETRTDEPTRCGKDNRQPAQCEEGFQWHLRHERLRETRA